MVFLPLTVTLRASYCAPGGPRLSHVPAAAFDFAEANARAPRCPLLVESAVQLWRRAQIPRARQNGGRGEEGSAEGRRGRAKVLKSGERPSSGPSRAGWVTQDSGLPGAAGGTRAF